MRDARTRAATACCAPTSGRRCRSGSAPCSACSHRPALDDLSQLQLLEVGCGAGGNLLELLRLGFAPDKLSGIELLPERLALARAVLPEALVLRGGDALDAAVADRSLDIVFVSTVFSSLLDDAYQQRLADAMWAWLKPGGAVLWYDFTVNNPRNPDVRGVPLARLRDAVSARAAAPPPRDAGAAAGACRDANPPGAVPLVQCAARAAHPCAGLDRQAATGAGHLESLLHYIRR